MPLQDMSEYISQIRKSLHSKKVDKILESMKCSMERKDCMYGECNICRGNSIPFDQNVNQGKQVHVSWFNWKTKSVDREKTVDGETVIRKVNITSKKADYGSLQVLLDEVDEDLPLVAKHNFKLAINIDH